MRLAFVLACALPILACAEDLHFAGEPFAEADLSGSLRLPLTTEDSAGVVYRLRDVHLEITGSALLSVSDRDGVRRESLVTQLPAGEYTVFLRPGWRLMARDESGREEPADAALQSANPFTVRVNQLGDETLGLTFKRGDEELHFGAGAALRVTRAPVSASTPRAL